MTQVQVRFLGSGDAFGSGGRLQTCFLLEGEKAPVLIDCGASALIAMKREGIDPSEIRWIVLSHLPGDHFGGIPFLILDGQFSRRTHRDQLKCKWLILTHMNEDMLNRTIEVEEDQAEDGLTVVLQPRSSRLLSRPQLSSGKDHR